MRQIQLGVLDDESVKELASGQRLQLLSGRVAVAEIVPLRSQQLEQSINPDRKRSRLALLERMKRGIDMGGFKIANRDELYDRD